MLVVISWILTFTDDWGFLPSDWTHYQVFKMVAQRRYVFSKTGQDLNNSLLHLLEMLTMLQSKMEQNKSTRTGTILERGPQFALLITE